MTLCTMRSLDDDNAGRPPRDRVGRGMRLAFLSGAACALLALAAPTAAQPVGPDRLDCARQDAVQRQMEAAKQKGQMLRRQRLETELATLNTRCREESKLLTRLDRIDQQQQRIRELELELQEARDALSALTAERP